MKQQCKKVYTCLSCGAFIREVNISRKTNNGESVYDNSTLCHNCKSSGVSYKTLPTNKAKYIAKECEVCGTPLDRHSQYDMCNACRKEYKIN